MKKTTSALLGFAAAMLLLVSSAPSWADNTPIAQFYQAAGIWNAERITPLPWCENLVALSYVQFLTYLPQLPASEQVAAWHMFLGL